MKIRSKHILVSITALGLGIASAAAISGPWSDCMGYGPDSGYGPGHGPRGQMRGNPEQRAEMRQQRRAARIEQLETQLKLTADQQEAWQAFEAAMDAQHQSMSGRWQRRQDSGTNALDHFNARITFMEERLAGMKAVAKAAGDLYENLTAEQQAVMDEFFANRRGGPRGGRRAG